MLSTIAASRSEFWRFIAKESIPLLAPNSHPNLLHPDQTIIAVIDMQESLLRSLYNTEQLLNSVRIVLQGFNALRLPIIGTTQNAEKLGPISPQISKLMPPLLPPFNKITFSCFGSSSFESEVRRAGRKQIVLCGAETHICVSQTALELISAGYQVHVAIDAVSSRTEANWRLGIDKMRQSGVFLTSVEMVLFELLREAETPEFREVLSLVK